MISSNSTGHNIAKKSNLHIGGENAVDQVLFWEVEGALEFVEIKGDLSGPGTVQPCFHERGPSVLQQKSAAHVVLTNPSHTREHHFTTVVLHRRLTEEEVSEAADLVH